MKMSTEVHKVRQMIQEIYPDLMKIYECDDIDTYTRDERFADALEHFEDLYYEIDNAIWHLLGTAWVVEDRIKARQQEEEDVDELGEEEFIEKQQMMKAK